MLLYSASLSKIEDGKFAMTLAAGEIVALEVQGTDGLQPIWSVADGSIVSISDDGRVKGISQGKTTIVANLGSSLVQIFTYVK